MTDRLVVFVCTGNICRSPMAEYLLKSQLPSDSPWEVGSAGVAAGCGMKASTCGVEVLREMRIDMTPHMSRPLDRRLVSEASVIVVMSAAHRDHIQARFPDVIGKVFLMKSFDPTSGGGDVEDPLGASVSVYRDIRDEIQGAMPGLVDFLQNLQWPDDKGE